MKLIGKILLLVICVCGAHATYAQMIADPTAWTYEVKKKKRESVRPCFSS